MGRSTKNSISGREPKTPPPTRQRAARSLSTVSSSETNESGFVPTSVTNRSESATETPMLEESSRESPPSFASMHPNNKGPDDESSDDEEPPQRHNPLR